MSEENVLATDVTKGPATVEGKSMSKMNALRHGILSAEAVLTRGELKESREELEALRDQLFRDLQPVGLIEIMLVDKLLMLYWRHRRVVRAERGAIEAQTVGFWTDRLNTRHICSLMPVHFPKSEEEADTEDEAALDRSALPNQEELEKIQRYERTIERGFLLTLHELQRVQKLRLGEAVPMVAALDVTVNSEG